MRRVHASMDGVEGEPRVRLQAHGGGRVCVSGGGGGVRLHINRWMNPGEECVPCAKRISSLLGHENVRCQRRATRSRLFIPSTRASLDVHIRPGGAG